MRVGQVSRCGSWGWGLGVLLLAAGCRPAEPALVHAPAVKVKTHRLSDRPVSQEISSFGSISFKQKTELASLVDGVVQECPAAEGATVRRGQVVIRLRNPQLEMRRAQAEAALRQATAARDLANAQLWAGRLQVEARIAEITKGELDLDQKRREVAELERVLRNKQSLQEAGGATAEAINTLKMNLSTQTAALLGLQKDLEIRRIGLRDSDLTNNGLAVPADSRDRLKAIEGLNTSTLQAELAGALSRVDSAQTELAACEAMIAELAIRAPADGIVGARQVEAGEYVQTGAKVLTLINTDCIYAVFPVPEQAAVKLREGMPVSVSLDAFPGKAFSARLDLVSPLIDAQSGNVQVKALLDNLGRSIKPGMFARVKVSLGETLSQTVLPESCLVRKDGAKARIMTVVNGRAFAREVSLERDLGGEWTVGAGCKAGELVIDEPSPLLREGSDVEG